LTKPYITKNKKYIWISTILLLLIWEIVAQFVHNTLKLPSPTDTILAFFQIIQSELFVRQVIETIKRALMGFGISFVIGVVFGLSAGFSDPIYYLLRPIILVQRAVPTMAIILLTLIWLNREAAPILVGFLIIFPIIYSAVVVGIRNIDHKLLEMTKIYQFDKKSKIRYLYIPSIWSSLESVSAAAISLNLKIVIAAEVLSQPKQGIGTGFIMEKMAFNTAGVFAWAIVAIIIAALFEGALRYLFSRLRQKI